MGVIARAGAVSIVENPDVVNDIVNRLESVVNESQEIMGELRRDGLQEDGKMDLRHQQQRIRALEAIAKLNDSFMRTLDTASKIQERHRINDVREWDIVMEIMFEIFEQEPHIALMFNQKVKERGLKKKLERL